MAKAKLLADKVYSEEMERLAGLAGFPLVPAAQADLKRALRRVAESDLKFLHKLITQFVDDPSGRCPKPGEVLHLAGQWRQTEQKPLGNPACLKCNGSGWVSSTKRVKVPGMPPYDAECAERCECAAKAGEPKS